MQTVHPANLADSDKSEADRCSLLSRNITHRQVCSDYKLVTTRVALKIDHSSYLQTIYLRGRRATKKEY